MLIEDTTSAEGGISRFVSAAVISPTFMADCPIGLDKAAADAISFCFCSANSTESTSVEVSDL